MVLRVAEVRSCGVMAQAACADGKCVWQSRWAAFPALLTPVCPALVVRAPRPSGLTPDPLDYAFPWHLLSVLGAVGALPPAVVELPQGGGHMHCCCVAYRLGCLVPLHSRLLLFTHASTYMRILRLPLQPPPRA